MDMGPGARMLPAHDAVHGPINGAEPSFPLGAPVAQALGLSAVTAETALGI